MTNWTLETLEDFEGVFFDAGMGWKVLFEIHLAISVRARYVGGAGTNFNTQISGIVWLDDDGADDNRDLRTELQYCYNAIGGMMSSAQTDTGGHHWTRESGRSEVWTLESMTADIGMGEFADLLIRPQSPEPLVWLIAALNRMQHLKLWKKLFFSDYDLTISGLPSKTAELSSSFFGAQTNPADDPEERMQQAWETLFAPFADEIYLFSPIVSWRVQTGIRSSSGYQCVRIGKSTNVSLQARSGITGLPLSPIQNQRYQDLGVVCLDYICRMVVFSYNGPDFVVSIGSATGVNIGNSHTGLTDIVIEGESPDLSFDGTVSTDFELTTAEPSTVPFDVPSGSSAAIISAVIPYAWVYCDLPEIMGAGELTAPIPTVSGEAEQEE